MIILSCRKDFTNPEKLIKSPKEIQIRDINLKLGKAVKEISMEELKVAISGKSVLILVHGYNKEAKGVYEAYKEIEGRTNYDIVVGFLWTGEDHAIEWYKAKRKANKSARFLKYILKKLWKANNNIDLMSHSLGARVTLNALKQSNSRIINNYFCTAGAVDNESLEQGGEFYDSRFKYNNIIIMHSKKDDVLKLSYTIAELDIALGLHGPENKNLVKKRDDIYIVNCENCVEKHGGYDSSDSVHRYINSFNPPQKRVITLPKN
ncbi:MAG: hypothetical protein CR982_06770 [Candidatus Cloacimonadota bacterium]|nr:MAG: hypothetical protein CR982_06770 [Candidatus Cloacimonadota bacterium]PIE77814.1 MAG: hypothetical protein CSA15_10995 [Candidatus Delongbacteria bacterium]